jgi:hypothetical protein
MYPPHVNRSGLPQAPVFEVLPVRNTKPTFRPFYLPGPSSGFEEAEESFFTSGGNNPKFRVNAPPQMMSNNTPHIFGGPSYDVVVVKSRPSYEWKDENELEVGESSKRHAAKPPGTSGTPHNSSVNTPGGGTGWPARMEEEGAVKPAHIPHNLDQNQAENAGPAKPLRRLAPIPLNFNTVYGPGTSSRQQPEAQQEQVSGQPPPTSQQTRPAKTANQLGKLPVHSFLVKTPSERQEEHYYWGTMRGGAPASQEPTKTFTQTENYPTLRDLVLASEPDYDFSGVWDGSTRVERMKRLRKWIVLRGKI